MLFSSSNLKTYSQKFKKMFQDCMGRWCWCDDCDWWLLHHSSVTFVISVLSQIAQSSQVGNVCTYFGALKLLKQRWWSWWWWSDWLNSNHDSLILHLWLRTEWTSILYGFYFTLFWLFELTRPLLWILSWNWRYVWIYIYAIHLPKSRQFN